MVDCWVRERGDWNLTYKLSFDQCWWETWKMGACMTKYTKVLLPWHNAERNTCHCVKVLNVHVVIIYQHWSSWVPTARRSPTLMLAGVLKSPLLACGRSQRPVPLWRFWGWRAVTSSPHRHWKTWCCNTHISSSRQCGWTARDCCRGHTGKAALRMVTCRCLHHQPAVYRHTSADPVLCFQKY